MFDEICVFSSSGISDMYFVEVLVKQKYIFPRLVASEGFDPQRWGFRHLLYYIVQLSRLEGSNHMLTDATGRSKVIFDVPKVILKIPQPPPIYKRRAPGQIYMFACKDIYFGSSKKMFWVV